MDGIDYVFYEKYPRIYAIATTFGFTKEDIEQMIENEIMLDEYCKKDHPEKESCELALRVLMVRLDVNKVDFLKTIKDLANTKTEDELKKIVGWRQINIVYALAGIG